MIWDAIAATAELIGVFGILVSIVYLGMQVRQSNRVAEDNSFQGLLALDNASYREMSVIENRGIAMKGLLDYDELTASDKLVFDNMLFGLFSTMESIFLSSDRQLIHSEQTDNASFFLRTRFLPYSGVRSWWSDSKGIFAPEVQHWVDSQIQAADMSSGHWGIKTDARQSAESGEN